MTSTISPIRPGLTIPEQRPDDLQTVMFARMAAAYLNPDQPLRVAMGESRCASMAKGFAAQLPRNQLRAIVTPMGPQPGWMHEAMDRVRIARAAKDLADSQWSLAYHYDSIDGGKRHLEFENARSAASKALSLAIEDALRTPVTRLWDVKRKQDLVGKREWAAKYRPDWQAIIDEDDQRLRAARKPRKQKEA